MQLSVDRDILQNVLAKAAGTVSNKDIQPILKNFLMKAETGRLSVLSTDNSLGAIAVLDGAQVDVEGTICVPAKKLLEMVNTSPQGLIHLGLTGSLLTVFTAWSDKDSNGVALDKPKFKNKWELHCEDAALYPEFPTFDESKSTGAVRDGLVTSIQRVLPAAADDELKLTLMAVYINNGYVYGADGHCAMRAKFDSALQEIMIPAPAAKLLVQVLKNSQTEQVKVQKTRFHLLFKVGNDVFHSRLMEAKYPDIEGKVFGQVKNYDASLKLKRDEVRKAVKRAQITSSEETKAITVVMKDSTCTFKTENAKEDRYEESFDFVEWDGEDFEHSINWSYLEDVLAVLSKDEVVIKLQKKVGAKTIFSFEEDDFAAILMPIRIRKDAEGNVERLHGRIKDTVEAKEALAAVGN